MTRLLMLGVFLAAVGCNDSDEIDHDLGTPDLKTLGQGGLCYDGIGGYPGTCGDGLVCCFVPCNRVDFSCLDLSGECEPTGSCASPVP